MTDSYPESFTIEIESEKLCRFWRRMWTLVASMPCLGFGAFFGLACAMPPSQRQREFESPMEVVITVITGMAIGLAIGAFLLSLTYYVFIRPRARREADALFMAVDGPFLRIKEGASNIKDRKLHFSAITDYAYFQHATMREFEIGGIELNTTGNETIRILGVKDALKVRDILSEIDRMRENG